MLEAKCHVKREDVIPLVAEVAAVRPPWHIDLESVEERVAPLDTEFKALAENERESGTHVHPLLLDLSVVPGDRVAVTVTGGGEEVGPERERLRDALDAQGSLAEHPVGVVLPDHQSTIDPGDRANSQAARLSDTEAALQGNVGIPHHPVELAPVDVGRSGADSEVVGPVLVVEIRRADVEERSTSAREVVEEIDSFERSTGSPVVVGGVLVFSLEAQAIGVASRLHPVGVQDEGELTLPTEDRAVVVPLRPVETLQTPEGLYSPLKGDVAVHISLHPLRSALPGAEAFGRLVPELGRALAGDGGHGPLVVPRVRRGLGDGGVREHPEHTNHHRQRETSEPNHQSPFLFL